MCCTNREKKGETAGLGAVWEGCLEESLQSQVGEV